MTIRVREMKDGEEPAVVDLLARVFRGWPPYSIDVDAADHLRWKLLRRPEHRRYQLVAEVDGALAGTFFVIERFWRIGERVCRASDGVDNVVDPAFRGMGVFSAMSDHFTQRFRVDFECSIGNYTVSPAVRHRYPPGADETLANPVGVYVAIGSLRRYLALRRRTGESAARTLGAVAVTAIRRALGDVSRGRDGGSRGGRSEGGARRKDLDASPSQRRSHDGETLQVRDLAHADARFDRLWSEAATSFRLIAVRDAEYLAWRYREPRAARYTIRGIEEGDRLLGYAVSRIDRGWSQLVDLMAVPGRDDVVAALAADTLHAARAAGAAGCRSWSLRHHPYEAPLRSIGFVRAPGEIKFICRPYSKDLDWSFVRDPRPAVHVSYGDSDHV